MDWQRCFTRKTFTRKTATIKWFEYSPLGNEFKKHSDIAKIIIIIILKGLDKVYEFNEKEGGEKINKDDNKPKFNIVINRI